MSKSFNFFDQKADSIKSEAAKSAGEMQNDSAKEMPRVEKTSLTLKDMKDLDNIAQSRKAEEGLGEAEVDNKEFTQALAANKSEASMPEGVSLADDPKNNLKEDVESPKASSPGEETPSVSTSQYDEWFSKNEEKIKLEDGKLMVKLKADGEETWRDLDTLKNHEAGQVAWDKKFGELNKEKQELQNYKDDTQEFLSKFAETAESDKMEAFNMLVEKAGMDSYEFQKAFRQELVNKYDGYVNMTEEQREIFEQQEELRYLRNRERSGKEARQKEQARRELENEFASIQEAHNISEDRRKWLESELKDVWKVDVTPANLQALHENYSRIELAEEVLRAVDPSLAEDDQKIKILSEGFIKSGTTDRKSLEEKARLLWNVPKQKKPVIEKPVTINAEGSRSNDIPLFKQNSSSGITFFNND